MTLTSNSVVSGAGTIGCSGGTVNMNGSYNVSGVTVINGGTMNFESGASSQNLTLSSGTLGGAGTLTVGGTISWTGGTMSGSGATTIGAGGALTVSGGSVKSFTQRTINNGGTMTWSGGTINSGVGATLNNQGGGLMDMQSDDLWANNLGGAAPVLNNAGTLRKSAGSGTSTIQAACNSSGTVDILSGTLTFNGSSFSNTATGNIRGVGTLNIATTTSGSSGQISPGTSPGILTVIGNLPYDGTSLLNIELGGTAAGAGYDQLVVNGNATLAGTLSLNLTNGFAPNTNNSFEVMKFTSRSGIFNQVVSGFGSVETTYTSTNVLIRPTGGGTAPPFSVQFEFNQKLQGTNLPKYSLNPYITASPVPTNSYHHIESPTGAFKGNFGNLFGTNPIVSSFSYTSFGSVLQEMTNGLWKITLDNNLPSASNYFFRVTSVSVTTDTFGQAQILFPPDGFTDAPKNSDLFWTGPNFPGLFIQLFSANFAFNIFSNANPAQFTLPFPPTMPLGTNIFQISYLNTNATSTITATPTNSSGAQLPGWSVSTKIVSLDRSQFTVSSNYLCEPPPSGLAAWYPGNGDANDVVGANNGTLQNGATFTTGEVGQAFSLDGVNDYVRVPSSSTLNPTGSFSLEAWIFPTRDQTGSIIHKWGDQSDYTNQRAYAFEFTSGGGLSFGISDDPHQLDASFHLFQTSAGLVTLNAWHHVAAVYDQTTGKRKIFVNGVQVAERTDTPITLTASIADLGIGAQPRSSTSVERFFTGAIDEMSLYNRALTAAEIQSIYNIGNAGKCPAGTGLKVAVYAADFDVYAQDVTNKIGDLGLFSQVDLYTGNPLPTPTLAELQQYDAVLVYSDTSFSNSATFGNVLADYVDTGGGVVVATFALDNALTYGLHGRMETAGYLPFKPGNAGGNIAETNLVKDLPGHPIVANVASFDGGSGAFYNSGIAITNGATLVAHYSSGLPLVGAKELPNGRVAGLNFFPPSSDIFSGSWDSSTDGALLMANALVWSAGSGGGAPDVTQFLVVKGQLFSQTGATPTAQTTNAEINMSVSTPGSPASSFVSSASVGLPNQNVVNLANQTDSFEFQDANLTTAGLNSIYPNGTYAVNIQTVHDGNFSVPLSLTGDTYPNTPTILNFSATQSVDPLNDFTLQWGAFTGGSSNDFVRVTVREISAIFGDTTVFESANVGQPGALNGTSTSVLIPANTLTSGTTYKAELLFGKLVAMDTTSYPGVLGFSAYYKKTEFDIITPIVIANPDVRNFLVVKGQLFTQTGTTPAAISPNAVISMTVNTRGDPASNFISGASVTLPNQNAVNLVEEFDSFEFDDVRTTTAALNAAYPNGTYTVNLSTVHDGDFQIPLSLTGDTYPNTPTIQNFSGSQAVNPFTDYTLSWGAFTAGTSNDFILVEIDETTVNGTETIFKTGSNPGDPDALNGTATSVVIPRGILGFGKTYQARLLFGKLVSFNVTAYPGVPGFSAYFKQTVFNLVTAGIGTVPLITNPRLPGRQVGLPYSAQLTATGGTGGFTWSITSGALPAGLSLNTATGVISGAPAATGTFNATFRVRDSGARTFNQAYSITIYPAPPGFPIATTMESEFAASGAFDGTNYLVAIQGDSNSPNSIIAQLVAPNGALIGSPINVGRTGARPSVAFGATNYLLVWQDDATAPSDDIYGQLISRSGQLIGAPFPISTANGQQELDSFQHVIKAGDNFFVAWRDGRTASVPDDGPTYVYGQFVSPAGNLVRSDIQISDNTGRALGLGFDGANILIAWNEDDNNTDIYGQFIDINGARVSGGNFVIDSNSLFSDNPIDVAFDGSRFLIAFHDEVSNNNWDLFARFADAETGVYPDRLTIANGTVDQHFPRVVNRSGRFFVTWLEGLGGTAAKTKARFFEPDGSASAEFVLIDNTTTRAPFTGIVGGGKKLLAVTDWLAIGVGNDEINIFDGDVYGQFFNIGAPQILVQPRSRTVTTGSTVNFGAIASGTQPLRFQWQFNGVNIAGATNGIFSIVNAQPANEGSYSVIVTNIFGDATSDAATLTVLAPPMITMQPVSQIVAIGANVTFSVSATAGGTITYQWRLNGVNIPGETGSSLTLLNVQPSNNGNYAVVVGNEIAAVDSQIARLFVTADALGLADNFADRVITNSSSGVGSGSNVSATKEISEPNHAGNPGGKSVWYAWQAPATGIATFATLGSSFDTLLAVYTGTNVNNLTLIARDNDRAGYLTSRVMFNAISNEVYNIAIDGSYGASGDVILSWSLEVTANLLPEILVQPQSQIVAQSSNATLTVVANTNAGPLAYQWLFKGDAISGATDSTFTIFNVQASNSGPYRVLISAGPRFVLSAAALVQVGELATVIALDKFLDVTPLGSGQPGQNSLIGQLRGNPRPTAAPAGGFTGTQIFNTFGATKEPGEPNHCGVPGGASYWYAYQAPAAGRLFVNTSNSTFDTVLAVYTGPATITSFSDIVSVDCANEPGFGTESLSVAATNGEIFYLVVDGVGGTSGVVTLNFNLVSSPSITAQPESKAVTPGSNVTFTVTASGGSSVTYQWRLNGNDIADATDSAYTVVASNAAVAGLYSVVVSNDADVVVSSVATLTVVGETTRPKVAITSPAEGSRASNTVVTVSGTASDNAGIYQVLWQINGGDNQVADGTTNWSASVPLNPGTNTFRVYSVDTSGNTASPTNSRKFVYVVLQPFALITNGIGSVTPSLGGQMLEIGKNHTVTATPGAGQLFINWTGGSTSTNRVLTFTMQTNLMLQANFLPNPFIPRQGTYSGLFYQTNVVAHQSSGFFTLTVSSSGSFSCKLLTAGLKPSAKGAFTFEGFANVSVVRKGLSPLTMSLMLDVTNQTGKVLGTVSDGSWVAALEGDRAVFNSVSNIAPQNGKYTLAFVHQSEGGAPQRPEIPGGDGVGTVTVDAAGKLALKGTLADGVKASQKTGVSKQGQWPFYLNLYSGQGSTIGWLTFTNRGTSSIEGDVSWIKTGVVPGKNYFGGFTNEVTGAGSHYPNPVPAGRILSITNGEVVLSANNLDPSLTNGIFLNTNNAVTVTSGSNNLKLTLTASSGAVKGTFTHPTNLATTKITGIILPEQNVVRGFFLNTTNSGAVILQGQ